MDDQFFKFVLMLILCLVIMTAPLAVQAYLGTGLNTFYTLVLPFAVCLVILGLRLKFKKK